MIKKTFINSSLYILLFIITISLSSCAILTSLFSPVTKLDFEKRPNYAINKSIHLWKDIKSEKIDFDLTIKDKKTRKLNRYNINSDYNDDGFRNINFELKNYTKNSSIEAKGILITKYLNKYLKLKTLNTNNTTLSKIPKNQWLIVDTSNYDIDRWLNLLSYDISISQKDSFWKLLKSAKIFQVISSSEGQLHDKDMFIYNTTIDKPGIKELFHNLFYKYQDILKILFPDTKITNNLLDTYINGIETPNIKIWINKTTFIIEKISLNFNIDLKNNNKKIYMTLEVNPNFISHKKINIDKPKSLNNIINNKQSKKESFIKKLEKVVVEPVSH